MWQRLPNIHKFRFLSLKWVWRCHGRGGFPGRDHISQILSVHSHRASHTNSQITVAELMWFDTRTRYKEMCIPCLLSFYLSVLDAEDCKVLELWGYRRWCKPWLLGAGKPTDDQKYLIPMDYCVIKKYTLILLLK